jgi:hypothetical protein
LASIAEQTMLPDDVLLIDDGANLDPEALPPLPGLRIWCTPWRSGVAHSFNFGVALARSDLVIMLGSDDRLMPDAVATCISTWQQIGDTHGYYYLPVQYHDGRLQHVPCNAAMVHKGLWNLTGGFPIEGSVGACDTLLINKMQVANGRLGTLYPVGVEEHPLYWYRAHEETDTVTRRKWHGVVAVIRNMLIDEVLNGGI